VFFSIGLLVAGLWYYSGRNPTLYEFISKYIPEKYLPSPPSVVTSDYSAVPNFEDDVQQDAPEINNVDLEDSETQH